MEYALGGKVGLLTAALDERIQALAAISGLDPLRLGTPAKGVEGIRQYSHLRGLIPGAASLWETTSGCRSTRAILTFPAYLFDAILPTSRGR